MYTDEQFPEPVGFKALQIQRLSFHLTFSLFPLCYYNVGPSRMSLGNRLQF